jgi:hypothetical protein
MAGSKKPSVPSVSLIVLGFHRCAACERDRQNQNPEPCHPSNDGSLHIAVLPQARIDA